MKIQFLRKGIMLLTLLIMSGGIFAGVSWRRPILPGGSIMKRNSNEKGAFIFGIGYEYEYLNDVQYEDQSAPNPAYEKTSNTTAILFANYGITENFSFEAIFPWRKVVNNKITYDTNQFIRKTSGFGDIIIMGRYSFLLFEDLLVMNIGGGFKLATGNLEIPDTEGNRISDNL